MAWRAVKWVGQLLLWGILISIGFWIGHKLTDKADILIDKYEAKRIANRVIKETEAELPPA